MNVQVEKQENSLAVLTVEVDADTLDKAIEKVYRASRNRINVPGFRRGKAPRKVIEKLYGDGIFYEDAANDVIDESWSDAAEQSGEEIVSMPEIEVSQIEAGKPLIYKAKVALRPPVKLGKYKGIKVEPIDTSVSDEELDAEVERQRGLNSRMIDVTDRPVKDGDSVTLDFEGFVDGKAFDGGKGENYPLTIGSGQFIPGFEEKLIGAEIDKELDVEVTFPEEYHEASLASKPAVFKCTVHSIKEKQLPELNDDYASDVSEFDTLEEYKEDLKKNLSEQKKKDGEKAREDFVLEQAVADSEMTLPDMMVESNVTMALRRTEMNMRYQGLTLEQYAQYTGQTVDSIREQLRPDVIKNLKSSLVLEEIAKTEGLALTDEEYEELLEKQAGERRMDKEKYKESLTSADIKEIRANGEIEKALKLIVDEAKETKEKKEKKEKEKK